MKRTFLNVPIPEIIKKDKIMELNLATTKFCLDHFYVITLCLYTVNVKIIPKYERFQPKLYNLKKKKKSLNLHLIQSEVISNSQN